MRFSRQMLARPSSLQRRVGVTVQSRWTETLLPIILAASHQVLHHYLGHCISYPTVEALREICMSGCHANSVGARKLLSAWWSKRGLFS